MTKTRIHELAQKMGIDNKELIARFKAVGVEVSSHMAVVDENDIKKLTPASPSQKEASQEEVRVKPTLIRRRPKHVEEAPAVKAEEPVPPVPEEKTAPMDKEITAEPKAALPPVEEPAPVREIPAPKEEPVPEPQPEAKPEPEAETIPETKPEPEKHVPGRARIIGRVEIPIPQPRHPARAAERPSRERQAPAPQERVLPPVSQEPVTVPEERKKGRKGREAAPVEAERGAKKGPAAAGKKKDAFKKVEIIEKRERVFEPAMRPGKGKKKEKEKELKKTEITLPKAIKRIIKISESITVGEMAKRMGAKATDLIRALMKMGMMATINHPLDFETAAIIASDFGYEVENVAVDLDEMLEAAPDRPEDLVKRPPVVTIMGHVDNGKT